MRALRTIACAFAALVVSATGAVADDDGVEIADRRLEVRTERGTALLPLFLSPNWDQPRPEAVRVVISFHGATRDAESYFNHARRARDAAGEAGRGTFIAAPQFLTPADLDDDAPADAERLLRWRGQRWVEGRPAANSGAPLSSYDAIDALLARFADRKAFPNLAHVVLAGHSAGGQIVHRYAIAGRGASKLAAMGIKVRYVVANPSSYAYFGEERPFPTSDCPSFNDWRYGMSRLPPYSAGAAPADLERAYLERDVVHLLGTDDTNPEASNLSRTCAANAQGPHRLARGMSYFVFLQKRHPDLRHRLHLVLDVGHSGGRMFNSPCGLAALFDLPGCESNAR
jgi:hypothetical protein